MNHNHILREAVESTTTVKIDPIVSAMKKCMNVCKLSKFRSQGECAKFYSSFFCGILEDDDQSPTVDQWGMIYNNLLSESPFCADLACYMALYQPAEFSGMFSHIMTGVRSETVTMKDQTVRYLHMAKSMVMMLQTRMAGVGSMVCAQVIDPMAGKFVTVVNQVLQQIIFDLTAMIQDESTKNVDKDAITYIPREDMPLEDMSEAAKELVYLLEHHEEIFGKSFEKECLSEGVVNTAKMKAKEVLIAKKKAERNFDEMVMKKVREMRTERRNRKHSEMVGESVRLMKILKRCLRSGALSLLSPALGVISFIVPIIIDRQTDKKDRDIIINDLKDEIEITDEKISQAERNGDDKAKVELMRFRQKLVREYERIQHVRYDVSTRVKYSRD